MNATHGNGVHAAETPPSQGCGGAGQRFGPPADCRRILIVGAGGFGREVLSWANDTWPDHAAKIAGFLSADASRRVPLPILGDPELFPPVPGDAFLLAIGIPDTRRRVAEALLAKSAVFLTLVHPTAIVATTATVGVGSIVCPYAIVSDAAKVGPFVLANYHSSLGHDSNAGGFSVLSPYATLGGNAQIGQEVFLGMHASVGPSRKVGTGSKISALSCALADVPCDSIVYGVPGRIAPRISL